MGDAAMQGIKADLARRIARIEWRGSPGRIAHDVDQIRTIAQRQGLLPAVLVAQSLGSALARGERGVLVHGWLALLGDAVASERQDAAACEAFAAACAVRFAA